MTNPFCLSTQRFEESCYQESWNTSSESRAATRPFITKQEVQQIWQITNPDSPTTCKRDQRLGTGDKKLHWRHCADLPAYRPYQHINSAGDMQWLTDVDTVTIHCERMHRQARPTSPGTMQAHLQTTPQIRWHHTKKKLHSDNFAAPVKGSPNSTQKASGLVENKGVCRGAHLVSRHWQKVNHCSKRVPTLPSINQHKTRGDF